MKKNLFFKLLFLGILIVGVNTYLNNNEAYHMITDRWVGYFVPLIWAIFIAILMDPAVDFFMEKFNMKKPYAITLVIFIFLLFIVSIFFIIVPQLIDSLQELSQKGQYITNRTTEIINDIGKYFNDRHLARINVDFAIQKATDYIKNHIGSVKDIVVSVFMNLVFWLVGFMNLFIGMMLAVLLIYDKKQTLETRDNLVVLTFGEEKSGYVLKKLTESKKIFLDYLVGKGITCLVMGVISTVILMVTGTPFSLLIGLLIGLGNMIPYVGSILFGAISVILILIMAPQKIFILIGVMCLVQFLDGFLLGPKIIGDKVGLGTFWVIVSVMIFGGLFGIVGMFLAVPIMSIIKSFYYDLLDYKKRKREV